MFFFCAHYEGDPSYGNAATLPAACPDYLMRCELCRKILSYPPSGSVRPYCSGVARLVYFTCDGEHQGRGCSVSTRCVPPLTANTLKSFAGSCQPKIFGVRLRTLTAASPASRPRTDGDFEIFPNLSTLFMMRTFESSEGGFTTFTMLRN